VVRVEPGMYPERIDVPDGVDLIARVPGTVTVMRPAGAGHDIVGISAQGDSVGRIQGIRIASTTELPLDVGMRISGQGRILELLELEGPMRAGLDVSPATNITIHGSHFEVTGAAMAFGEQAHAVVTRCVFVRRGDGAPAPAVWVAASAEVALGRNIFAGYGA